MSPELVLHGLHAALLFDELVDDLGRLAVLQLGLRDAAHVEQVLELWVQVVELQEYPLVTEQPQGTGPGPTVGTGWTGGGPGPGPQGPGGGRMEQRAISERTNTVESVTTGYQP